MSFGTNKTKGDGIMKQPVAVSLLALSALFASGVALAAEEEILLTDKQNTDMSLSIYNNNLAFVRDTRSLKLPAGRSLIAFEGVARQIKPETAMLTGSNLRVIEQNYDYNLLNAYNLLNTAAGQKVKTAVTDPENGRDIFDSAVILNGNSGSPVLQFSYGIETNFPGRIIYEKIPEGLRTKPTLIIDVENARSGTQNVELAYLTNGISWKADYIAEISSSDKLNLNGWVTLDNQSGTDYKDAKVQLIAGSVNQVRPIMPRSLNAGLIMKAAAFDGAVAESGAAAPATEALGDYYMYSLPFQTTIKDKQSKQVSLMTKPDVAYTKEYRLISPLYIGLGSSLDEFEKQTPSVIFKITNGKASNLGEPLPAGTLRMYEKDSSGNLQFIGESSFPRTAVGEKIELNTGSAFDIWVKGRLTQSQNIAKDTKEISAEITFENAKAEAADMVFIQNFGSQYQLLEENMTGTEKNSRAREWKFNIKPGEKQVLTFKIRVTKQ